jgi:hypothetical protein
MNADFIIFKGQNGFAFYEVRVTNGSVAKELSGQYTKLEWAIKAVTSYIERSQPSPTAVRDMKTARNVKEKKLHFSYKDSTFKLCELT